MFPDVRPGATDNAAGWTCAACGMWVPINTHHVCGGIPNYEMPDWTCGTCGYVVKYGLAHHCPGMQPTTLDFTSGTPLVDVELHNKLDKIAELLGRIVRKIGA